MTRTWPEDWAARKQGVECWFCKDQLGKPFFTGSVGDAHLERHAIARGHAIVIFRDRHVADFTSLSASDVAAYWQDVHAVARMIEHVFAPCHMNYQLLGNIVPHCTSILCQGTSTILLQENRCPGSRSLSIRPSTTSRSSFWRTSRRPSERQSARQLRQRKIQTDTPWGCNTRRAACSRL